MLLAVVRIILCSTLDSLRLLLTHLIEQNSLLVRSGVLTVAKVVRLSVPFSVHMHQEVRLVI